MALPVYFPRAFEDYLQNMIAYLVANASSLKNFKPGSRIRTLLEAVALELASTDGRFHEFNKYNKRESCYATFGFNLKSGNKATGVVRIMHTGHLAPYSIPPFTITLFGLEFESGPVPGSIAVGQTFADVGLSAKFPGSEHNLEPLAIDTDQGRGTVRPQAGTWDDYERIVNLVALTGGTDRESEASRETRFAEFVGSLARSTLSGIRAGVLAVDGVLAAHVDENKNPITLAPETGWVLVYVTDGSPAPPQALLDEVKKVVDGDPADEANYPGFRAAGVRSHVAPIAPFAVSLNIDINLKATSLLTDAEAIAIFGGSITGFINRLISGQNVILQQVAAAAHNALVSDIHSITFNTPTADILVPAGQLPRIGGAGGGTFTVAAVNRIA